MDCFGAGRYTCSNRFGIHQWPTLKLFKYGQYQGDYSGPYDEGKPINLCALFALNCCGEFCGAGCILLFKKGGDPCHHTHQDQSPTNAYTPHNSAHKLKYNNRLIMTNYILV